MTDALIVFSACADETEASRIANALVEGRLAACVNIFPAVRSVYRWQGSIEHASEILLAIKTTRERFGDVRETISALHSYDTPEIVGVPVTHWSERYLAWLRAQV